MGHARFWAFWGVLALAFAGDLRCFAGLKCREFRGGFLLHFGSAQRVTRWTCATAELREFGVRELLGFGGLARGICRGDFGEIFRVILG